MYVEMIVHMWPRVRSSSSSGAATSSMERACELRYRLAESHLVRGQLLCDQDDVVRGLHWMARAFREAPEGAEGLRWAIRTNLAGWNREWTPPRTVLVCRYPVHTLAFSPDGRTVLTASADRTAQLWSAETDEPHGRPLKHDEPVDAVAFCPGGDVLVTGSIDMKIRFWPAETGRLLGSAPGGGPYCSRGRLRSEGGPLRGLLLGRDREDLEPALSPRRRRPEHPPLDPGVDVDAHGPERGDPVARARGGPRGPAPRQEGRRPLRRAGPRVSCLGRRRPPTGSRPVRPVPPVSLVRLSLDSTHATLAQWPTRYVFPKMREGTFGGSRGGKRGPSLTESRKH